MIPSTNNDKTVFVSDQNIADLFDWSDAVKSLTDAYSSDIKPEMVPARTMARGDGFWLRSLCAVSPSGDYFGCKLIAASPRMGKASYLISLFDQNSMKLAAIIDGNQITNIRTAAISIVAVNAVNPKGALRVGVIGSSSLARGMMSALLSVREVSRARVYSPTPASRERYADDFRTAHGLDIEAAESPQQALDDVDVVICAARSRDESPVLLGEWIKPGTVVLSVGSTLPEQREVDVELIRKATVIVADMPEEVVHETGDALAAIAEGVDVAAKTVGLNDVVAGRIAARRSADDIVVYKSVGSALQDVVTAEMLLKKAIASNRFNTLEQSIVTIDR